MQVFTRGDLLRNPSAQLLNPDSSPIDLTMDTVQFRMVRQKDGFVKVDDAAATIVNSTAGLVRYDWQSSDVDEVGDYFAWFIRIEGGATEHFPAGRGYVIKILDDS